MEKKRKKIIVQLVYIKFLVHIYLRNIVKYNMIKICWTIGVILQSGLWMFLAICANVPRSRANRFPCAKVNLCVTK